MPTPSPWRPLISLSEEQVLAYLEQCSVAALAAAMAHCAVLAEFPGSEVFLHGETCVVVPDGMSSEQAMARVSEINARCLERAKDALQCRSQSPRFLRSTSRPSAGA
jgi:hypothetical protein